MMCMWTEVYLLIEENMIVPKISILKIPYLYLYKLFSSLFNNSNVIVNILELKDANKNSLNTLKK